MTDKFALKTQHGPDVSPRWRHAPAFKKYAVGDVVTITPDYQRWVTKTCGPGPFVVRGINPAKRDVWIQDVDGHNLGYREPLHWFQKDNFLSAIYRRRQEKLACLEMLSDTPTVD